ncbi:MAG: thioredoxin [Bacilli bacterium]
MSVIHLENENFEELIKNKKVVVDFYATWCGPCKMFGPVFEKVSNESSITFIKIDVDAHEDIARKYGIMSIPTIVLLNNGEVEKKHMGFMTEDELKKFI